MTARAIYLEGQKIGNMVYLRDAPSGNNRMAVFRCHCGAETVAFLPNVKRYKTKSCGCSRTPGTHNLTKHPLFVVWYNMKKRCNSKNSTSYYLYGARGITICNEWLVDFKTFHDWCIDNGWEKGLTLDRTNNDGNYEPSNCRFLTIAENCRNSRQTKLNWDIINEIRNAKLLLKERFNVSEVAREYGVTKQHIGCIIRNKRWVV